MVHRRFAVVDFAKLHKKKQMERLFFKSYPHAIVENVAAAMFFDVFFDKMPKITFF